MFCFKLILAYEGTNYSGWQIQPNGTTVQELLQKKIAIILREDVTVTGSGRTDAGVHAYGQAAHFHTEKPIDIHRFKYSLNATLPRDIRVLEVSEVPHTFHARYSAIGKIYHYHLTCGPVQDPFKRFYSLHVPEKLDIALLKCGAACFVGTHDFTSFANEAYKGSAAKNPVCTIKRLDVVEHKRSIRLEFEGDRFLYKMVRNITGTLLEVALKKESVDTIALMLQQKDRKCSGQAAPPHGLFLMQVNY